MEGATSSAPSCAQDTLGIRKTGCTEPMTQLQSSSPSSLPPLIFKFPFVHINQTTLQSCSACGE